jgi:arylsulfatase A-like enzyme
MPGNELNNHFIEWIKDKNDPYFCWLHYLDTHFPYISDSLKKDEMIRLNLQRQKWFLQNKNVNLDDLDKVKNLYIKKVHDVDSYIGELVDNLKKINKYDNTIFIITADHGEELYEHGSFHHDLKLYEELIHVPLIISGKGIKRHTIDKVVSHIDLAPTLLDILEIKKPKLWIGDNLLLNTKNIAISEEGQKTRGDARLSLNFKLNLDAKKVAIIWDKWKYIYSEGNGEELYDLSVDEGEKENLLKEDEEQTKEVINIARDALNKHMNLVYRFKSF